MRTTRLAVSALLVLSSFGLAAGAMAAEVKRPEIEPLVRTVDLDVGQQQAVELCDGTSVRVKLVGVKERRDAVRGALREALVTVEIDGEPVTVSSCLYHLPKTFGRVQIDCPVTKGFVQKGANPWSLDRDARLRLWPKGSPWIRPGTFGYPLRQRWFGSQTQMSNETADDENLGKKTFYYHWGLDFGGADRLEDVLAATDGTVISVGGKLLGKGPYSENVKPRYDVIYIRDGRNWYYRYSHLDSFDPAVKLGARVTKGQKIGTLGKKGASGGWSHLHLDVDRPQPSGRYGIDDAYAFAWQAYQEAHPTPLVAVARPRELVYAGEPVTLDASRSWNAAGPEAMRYQWSFGDGATADGARVTHLYERPGHYSPVLKVSDSAGRVAYDFGRVFVFSRKKGRRRPPNVHATYWPTMAARPGKPVTFTVLTRNVRPDEGQETWDFGDGSPTVTTQSSFRSPRRGERTNYETQALYAKTTHVYQQPGEYLVTVQRTNDQGETGTDHLYVRVEPAAPRVATFRCDATPAPGQSLFADDLKTVEHPLEARGIVLDDGRERYVLAAVDWCILAGQWHGLIRHAIADAAGTTAEHVCLHVVHQHTAPLVDSDYVIPPGKGRKPSRALGSEVSFVQQVAARLAAAVRDALGRLEPFDTVGTSQAKVERVASARRVLGPNGRALSPRFSMTKELAVRNAPEGLVDPFLKTITLAKGTRPLVRLHYYAVHPQSWYRDHRASYDFVGMARAAVEKKDGAFQLYFTGCAGNVTVGKYNDGTPAARAGLAERLQTAMEASIASTQWAPAGTIGWRTVPLVLPRRTDKGYNEADLRAQQANPKTPWELRARAGAWLAFLRHADRPLEVTTLRLGPAYIVHLPGEPFVQYQLFAQQTRPDDFVAVAGYGNGRPWYICTEAAFAEGGYEPTASAVSPESEKILRNAIRQSLVGP